ncbi:MAG: DCC1-like thiol-disulfide oxidoreductase family protein [Granulosicoccus sp.]
MTGLRSVFSIDLRSLALFRMVLAVLLLCALARYSPLLFSADPDSGLLTRDFRAAIGNDWHWSLHAASTSLWWQSVLFILAAMSATGLLFGYRTHRMAVASFVLLASLLSHNDLMLQSGDQLLLVLCFWAMFLPLGARYSTDAALQNAHQQDANSLRFVADNLRPILTVATVAVVLQLIYAYAHALLLHNGIAHFQLANCLALALLLPVAFWMWLRKVNRRQSLDNIRLYYDKDCGFCLKMCLLLREFLLADSVTILPAQSNATMQEILERENSWVVTNEQGGTYVHWHAMAFLFSQRWPFKPLGWLMRLPPLMRLGNHLYRIVGNNRDRLGDFTARWLPYRPLQIKQTTAGATTALFFLVVVGVYNVYHLPPLRSSMPALLETLARLVGIDFS